MSDEGMILSQFQSLVPYRNPVNCLIYFHLILLTPLEIELGQLVLATHLLFFRAIK